MLQTKLLNVWMIFGSQVHTGTLNWSIICIVHHPHIIINQIFFSFTNSV